MKDIQSLHDSRRINIRKVGVKTISYPITLLDKEQQLQRTVATVNMYVNLPHQFKGTHMSRFVEILNQFHGEINIRSFHHILETMKERLDAEAAHMEMSFTYFMPADNDGSGFGIERYQCTMHGALQEKDDLVMTVEVPIQLPGNTTPWGKATVSVRLGRFLWLEDVIKLVQETLSASLPEEGEEQISRRLGKALTDHSAISWFHATVENRGLNYDLFASIQSEPSSATIFPKKSIQ